LARSEGFENLPTDADVRPLRPCPFQIPIQPVTEGSAGLTSLHLSRVRSRPDSDRRPLPTTSNPMSNRSRIILVAAGLTLRRQEGSGIPRPCAYQVARASRWCCSRSASVRTGNLLIRLALSHTFSYL
jgi:hypothetical protein